MRAQQILWQLAPKGGDHVSNLVGSTLGKYRIVARQGSGGMADVYKAHQPGLDRFVAIKILQSHLADKRGFVQRFEREGAALARLRHQNIVQVHDFDSQDDLHYLVMEFIDGPNLRDALKERIDQGQLFSPIEAARFLSALAGAVDYAHAHGMVHRDIKPANIMFTDEGQIVLADFGIAHIVGAPSSTQSGAIGGTPDYMSPEQCKGEQVDARSDIYALGATLYELLTGRVPFIADNPVGVIVKHISEPPPPPSEVNPDLSPAVGQVLLKALNKDPDDRYQTAAEMANAMRQALSLPVAAPHVPLPLPAQPAQPTIPLEPRPEAPFQAPPDLAQFVGREEEMSDLRAALVGAAGPSAYCLIGMGGIGKTALAVHIAHALRDHFVDGVLWASAATSEPLAILDSWARAYDCDFSSLHDLESRAAAMRGVLADKRVLVVLDDVRSADVVRPLLPAGPGCAALLTTRDTELAISLGLGIYPLSALPIEACRRLMAHILGEERVSAEQDCADEICSLLGNLPLAVEIAAQRLASRRRWRLADLAERLRDEESRLRELRIRDREVRASFALSWEGLDETLRRSFALLAVFQGRPFTPAAFAVVAELEGREAGDHLHELEALSLVSEEGRVHYRQHPLLADFSREQLGDDRRAYALMAWYYLAYATEHQKDYPTLEQEWDNLLNGMRTAREQGMRQVVVDYAEALTDAWFALGRYTDARQSYAWAARAAQAQADRPAQARCLCLWGRACTEQSGYGEAERHLSLALEMWRELGDQSGIASALYHLGHVAAEQADYDEAQQLSEQSQRIREQLGEQAGVAEALYQQAWIQRNRLNFETAEQLGRKVLTMQQAVDDRIGRVRTLVLLAECATQGTGDLDAAEGYCRQALALCEQLDEREEMAPLLYAQSAIYRRRGDLSSAREHAELSLALFQRAGERQSQAHVLYQLCLISKHMESYDLALQYGLQSLDLCQDLGDDWDAVYILRQLGILLCGLGRPGQAREKWAEGLAIAERLKHPMLRSLRDLHCSASQSTGA
jgi:tetratricopeptide (TPR) repeat protein/predicted Ser/Thr protein kinase